MILSINVLVYRGYYFLFDSVFINKKITKPNLKKNRNRFKPTGFGSVRIFRTKTGSNRFGLVFSHFFLFGFGSVRFFRFQAYKTEMEPVGFFKILIGLIGFFSLLSFFSYFFSNFLDLIGFFIHPYLYIYSPQNIVIFKTTMTISGKRI